MEALFFHSRWQGVFNIKNQLPDVLNSGIYKPELFLFEKYIFQLLEVLPDFGQK